MIGIVGMAIVFATVFGGYILAGGKLGIILYALPFELMMIAGAAIGGLVIANNKHGITQTLKDVAKVFKGPHWTAADYRDLLCLLFQLVRIQRANAVELDGHIEDPGASTIFAAYPRILADAEAVALICDTLRAASLNYSDPHQVEAVLEKRVEAHGHHAQHSSHTLQVMADGLPALGIVAAVLGVIKTMASIDQPPEILGKMIGSALVGTFLGVFLAYGVVGPFATRLRSVIEDEANFYALIREVMVAHLHEHPPAICVEVGRQHTPAHLRPSYNELDEALRAVRQGNAPAAAPSLAA